MTRSASPVFDSVDFSQGRVFETADLDEVRALSSQVLSPHRIEMAGPGKELHSRMERLAIGSLSLVRLRWGAAVAVDPGQLQTYYLISVPISGSAIFSVDGQPFEITPQCAAIVSPSQRFHFSASSNFSQVVLKVGKEAVDNGWLAIGGEPLESSLEFEPGMPISGLSWKALEPTMRFLANNACTTSLKVAPDMLGARLQEMLVTTLLLQQPHGHADSVWPRQRPAPSAFYVRRAERFMNQHMADAISVSDVASSCGVSVRTLQLGFKHAHQCGPMQWLREQRLQCVREAIRAGATTSISDIALGVGFTHLGEFSRAYRSRFGETASQTLSARQARDHR